MVAKLPSATRNMYVDGKCFPDRPLHRPILPQVPRLARIKYCTIQMMNDMTGSYRNNMT